MQLRAWAWVGSQGQGAEVENSVAGEWRTWWPVGGELGGRWVEAFAAVLQGVTGDQRAAGSFCWLE